MYQDEFLFIYLTRICPVACGTLFLAYSLWPGVLWGLWHVQCFWVVGGEELVVGDEWLANERFKYKCLHLFTILNKMISNLIRIQTDSTELAGLWHTPRANLSTPRALVHFHGCGGNFYENHFLDAIAAACTDRGIGFLSVNSASHDYVCEARDLCKPKGAAGENSEKNRKRRGFAYETFEDCEEEISAVLQFLAETGIGSTVLQGHSTGANKIVYYHSRKQGPAAHRAHKEKPMPKGYILMGMNDDFGMQRKFIESFGETLEDSVTEARRMITRGRGEEFFRHEYLGVLPIAARSYANKFHAGSAMNNFPVEDEMRHRQNRCPAPPDFSQVRSIDKPVLCVYGEDDEYLQIPPQESTELFKAKAINCPQFSSRIIPGCGHGFEGKETELADSITEWAEQIMEVA